MFCKNSDTLSKIVLFNYFLAANCYFNMTQYGNSWMMRRYFWTSNAFKTKLEDDEEYFNCLLAKQFYLKAKEVTRSKKFAALCLRMAGRCESYRMENLSQNQVKSNKYYLRLKKEYPADYEDLMSNCESFTRYFNSWKS